MENNHTYAKIITVIALALFSLFWTTIDGQLKALDVRMRCVEQQIAAISASLGVKKAGSRDPQDLSATPPTPSRLEKTARGAPITP